MLNMSLIILELICPLYDKPGIYSFCYEPHSPSEHRVPQMPTPYNRRSEGETGRKGRGGKFKAPESNHRSFDSFGSLASFPDCSSVGNRSRLLPLS